MDETQTTEESQLDRAQRIADQQDRANKKLSENLERLEKLKAIEMVSGTATAGQEPEKPKEETAAEYMKRVMKGDLNDKR